MIITQELLLLTLMQGYFAVLRLTRRPSRFSRPCRNDIHICLASDPSRTPLCCIWSPCTVCLGPRRQPSCLLGRLWLSCPLRWNLFTVTAIFHIPRHGVDHFSLHFDGCGFFSYPRNLNHLPFDHFMASLPFHLQTYSWITVGRSYSGQACNTTQMSCLYQCCLWRCRSADRECVENQPSRSNDGTMALRLHVDGSYLLNSFTCTFAIVIVKDPC